MKFVKFDLMRPGCVVVSMFLLGACSPAPLPPLAPAEVWLHPPGGSWTPDRLVVFDMKQALDTAVRPALEKNGDIRLPPGPYWFQYLGLGPSDDRYVFFVGRPFPIPVEAATEFRGGTIPEHCHIWGSYVPSSKTLKDFSVGGFHCPPRL
jgi:hypothetical protein